LSAADRPPSPADRRDAVDVQVAKALRSPPAVPAAIADEPDDDAILRVLEGRADPAERARVEAAPLAAEKLAILGNLIDS
jgi:hypothetical protein